MGKFVQSEIMDASTIRKQLHNYLEVAEDKKIKAIYITIKEAIDEKAVDYTKDLKAELEQRNGEYKSGKVKVISAEESKKRIQKLLNAGRPK